MFADFADFADFQIDSYSYSYSEHWGLGNQNLNPVGLDSESEHC